MTQNQTDLILDRIYANEQAYADEIFLTQPVGNGKVQDYTWTQTMDQSRRMAAHLKSLGLPRAARVAILSKNCAHFFMAELAIWMAGYTTVAIFPTEHADTVKFVLEHSEASLLFVGKLDEWHKQEPGVPAELPRIAFPLAPANSYDKWDDITARTQALQGESLREPSDIAMIIYTWFNRSTQRCHAFVRAHERSGRGHCAKLCRQFRAKSQAPHAVLFALGTCF